MSALVEPALAEPADRSMAIFDTQRIGRMGELVVELELLKRGWIVGNFNHTVLNSAGWDLFATMLFSMSSTCEAQCLRALRLLGLIQPIGIVS